MKVAVFYKHLSTPILAILQHLTNYFVLLQFQQEERSLLVSALKYLAPEYQWISFSDQLTTGELYIILEKAIRKGDEQGVNLILAQLPESVLTRLQAVVQDRRAGL